MSGNIDGARLLSDLGRFIKRFVTLSQAQADVCAIWTIHTHAIGAADFTPYLSPNSPVKRSGKTRLLEVERLIVSKPWFTGRVTASALVRKTHHEHPTLLLDESDAAFQGDKDYSEALRGILNTGFERDGSYSMSVQSGNDWKPQDFSTFSPKMIAGIGRLPQTVEDRSIPIRLKRARRDEQRERFRKRKVQPEAAELKKQVEAWVAANLESLRQSEPQLPDELNDRQQDVCEPLLAIADLAGQEWPARARAALIELCTGVWIRDDSVNLRLLADIRQAFRRQGSDRLSTYDLLHHLTGIEEAPWPEFERGKPLGPFQLSRLLSPFDVLPRDIRFDQGTRKGYLRADLEESWARYLDDPPGSAHEGQQGQQASVHAGFNTNGEGQQGSPVAAAESAESPVNTRVVADVAPAGGNNGRTRCYVHPRNEFDWWKLRDGTPVCGLCHPNPAML